MSDTVKLIIEIPKEMMKALEVGNLDSKYNPYDVCWQVRNGIPLNDVKAEIVALPKIYPFVNHIDTYVKEDDVLQILDNIGKAESETN